MNAQKQPQGIAVSKKFQVRQEIFCSFKFFLESLTVGFLMILFRLIS